MAKPVDQAQIDGGALALCRVYCNAKKAGKAGIGGRCSQSCEGARDIGIWESTHMQRMRDMARAVLEAEPAVKPNGRNYF